MLDLPVKPAVLVSFSLTLREKIQSEKDSLHGQHTLLVDAVEAHTHFAINERKEPLDGIHEYIPVAGSQMRDLMSLR